MSRRAAAAGLAAAVLSVLVDSVPPGAGTPPVAVVRHEIVGMLAERAQAVVSADPDSWLDTVDAGGIDAQRTQFQTLGRLGLERWSERLTALEGGSRRSWRASVEVRYRFPGDRTDAVVDAVLDITPRLLVAGSTAAALAPWEIAGARTETGRHSVVVGAGPSSLLRTFATELDWASASVGRLLGEPPTSVVLMLPGDWDQVGRMIPTSVGPSLAAATSELGSAGTTGGPARILAVPSVLTRLDPRTRIAVFGHETFHVATHGITSGPSPAARWLSEGLADYLGYRGSGIPLDQAVSGLLRQVRVNGAPDALPADDAFLDPRRASLAYEGSHVAVRMLVAEHGVADVVAVYMSVSTGSRKTDSVLQEILATDLADVTASWRAEVASLAAG